MCVCVRVCVVCVCVEVVYKVDINNIYNTLNKHTTPHVLSITYIPLNST